jgi:spectinomycin phosphotransferase
MSIEFLPRGYDPYAGVYRVQASDADYFVKVKHDNINVWSVRLPRYLKAQGLEEVVAPLPTLTDMLWGRVDEWAMLVYPFILEQDTQLSDEQWRAFGNFVKKLHTIERVPELVNMPREAFIPHSHYLRILRQLQAEIPTRTYSHPIEQDLARFWHEKEQIIANVIERTEHYGAQLRTEAEAIDHVICHADLHTGNLMFDAEGKLFVVDWNQPILAPRERDLMFVTVGAFVSDKHQENLFFEGYGTTPINELVMAYYRVERTMQDMAAFAEDVFLRDASDQTKEDSAWWFRAQFE